jgi:hypothetical protein
MATVECRSRFNPNQPTAQILSPRAILTPYYHHTKAVSGDHIWARTAFDGESIRVKISLGRDCIGVWIALGWEKRCAEITL